MKKKPILSHREFKRNVISHESPAIVKIRAKAQKIAERIKKAGING